MSGIRGRDTRPELVLRSALHARGLRFRLHVAELPGRPDIVLPRHRAVILVHGCYWHRHPGCRYATTPATRTEFWLSKFESNVTRDANNHAALRVSGWRVAVVWECALRSQTHVTTVSQRLADWLDSGGLEMEIGRTDLT